MEKLWFFWYVVLEFVQVMKILPACRCVLQYKFYILLYVNYVV